MKKFYGRNKMKNFLYDKRFLFIVRCIGMLCSAFLVGVQVYHFNTIPLLSDNRFNYANFHILFGNNFVILFLFLLGLFPYKIEFLAIVSFYYGVSCTLFDTCNPMGVCMYYLGNITLFIRGYYRKNGRKKLCSAVLFFIILLMSNLRHGFDIFLSELIEKMGYCIVIGIQTLFLIYTINSTKNISKEVKKILNLAAFPGGKEDDVLLLQKVLENKQYKEIASEVFRSEGTVRNRLNKVYDLLGVMDRMGFITTYTGYEIVYKSAEENISNTSVNDSDVEINTVAGLKNSIDKLSSILKKKKDVLHP